MPADKKTIRERVLKWVADQLPTARRTLLNPRHLPAEIIGDLDVDRVHEIITASQNGQIEGLFQLYRDLLLTSSHLQGRLGERKEAVLGDTLSLQPVDKANADDVAAAAVVQDMIETCAEWEATNAHLLDSVLWPVAVAEKTYKPSRRVVPVAGGKPVSLSYELAGLTLVPYELLAFQNMRLQLRDTDAQGNLLTTFSEIDPARYIVHRGHLLSTPDNWGGPMRSVVMWLLLSIMSRGWWARFLERYGSPFLVAKYDQSDDATRSILENAFRYCVTIGGLVVSSSTQVEMLKAAASDSGDAYDKFRQCCNDEISNLVLGQSLSSNAKPTGLGSGTAGLQGEVRQDKRKSDARRLGAVLRYHLAEQFLRINGLAGRAPKFVWGSDTSDESAATGTLLVSLKNANLQPTDEALPTISERVGFQIERTAAPAPILPEGGGLQLHSAALATRLEKADAANAAIIRRAVPQLAKALPKHYAPIIDLVATSKSPKDAIARVEAYCASLEPLEAAEILETAIASMAANGSVAAAR